MAVPPTWHRHNVEVDVMETDGRAHSLRTYRCRRPGGRGTEFTANVRSTPYGMERLNMRLYVVTPENGRYANVSIPVVLGVPDDGMVKVHHAHPDTPSFIIDYALACSRFIYAKNTMREVGGDGSVIDAIEYSPIVAEGYDAHKSVGALSKGDVVRIPGSPVDWMVESVRLLNESGTTTSGDVLPVVVKLENADRRFGMTIVRLAHERITLAKGEPKPYDTVKVSVATGRRIIDVSVVVNKDTTVYDVMDVALACANADPATPSDWRLRTASPFVPPFNAEALLHEALPEPCDLLLERRA